ncbi:hypothetical protein [Sphingomonas sp.]|uniref:hypothetical protein n=1 Tax=Sphingomonas sp. TaxID=28214 RepID=UPI0025EADF20|nr:hypothetical protein [Sphingomonas sp.]
MGFKRSLKTALGVAAVLGSLPSVASAAGSITLSIGSGYDNPYYGVGGYSDYGRDVYSDGNYDGSYDSPAIYDDGDYNAGYYSDSYSGASM